LVEAMGRALDAITVGDARKVRFSATLGDEPGMELACVIVPLCTENVLRFSARLDDRVPDVRLERGPNIASSMTSDVY
jgi:hypothetical protein